MSISISSKIGICLQPEKRVNEIFSKKNVEIVKSYVGRYATSLEMAGMSISIFKYFFMIKKYMKIFLNGFKYT